MKFSISPVAALVAASVVGLGGCGGGGDSQPSSQASTTASTTASTAAAPGTTTSVAKPRHAHGEAARGRQREREPAPERPAIPPGVAEALRSYVAALDAHDGAALCELFAPGALDVLDLPVGSGCDGISESVGYDPGHGLPHWRDAGLGEIQSVATTEGGVRATVTMVDRYAGNPQPSIEDDVIYLQRDGEDWLIEQPSVTIYRAIGTPDPPPSVLAPPD